MQEKVNRLFLWAKGQIAPPYLIDINPTDYCNLRCISCWQRNRRFEGKLDSKWYEVSGKRLLALVDEAKELGIKRWEITGGGEPFIRKNLVRDLTKKIRKYGMNGNITTNGTLFTKEVIHHLIKTNWSRITFSIDGPDAKTNDFLRGSPNAFRKATEALKLIKREKSILKKDKPKIAFNVVLSNKNYDKLNQMIKLANKYNCEFIKFEPITIHSKEGEKLKLNRLQITELQKNIPLAEKSAKKYRIKTNLYHLLDTNLVQKSNHIKINKIKNDFLSLPCYEPWYHIVIKVDGTAGPCCIYDKKKLNIKNKTLKEIWYSNYFNKLRKKIIKGKLPDFCKICNAGQIMENKRIRELLEKRIS